MNPARLFAVLFAAAPFAFGLIRYRQTGSDTRMLGMAVASFVGAILAAMVAKSRHASGDNIGTHAVIILVTATVFAAAAGYLQGAMAAAGVWPVGLVFGLCWAARFFLTARARHRVA